MANTEQVLINAARTVAADTNRDAGQRRLDLENEVAHTKTIAQAPGVAIDGVEAKLGAIEVTTDYGTSALKRAKEYVPKDGDNYLCPVCWVKEGTKVRLDTAVDSRLFSLVCPDCKAPFPAI